MLEAIEKQLQEYTLQQQVNSLQAKTDFARNIFKIPLQQTVTIADLEKIDNTIQNVTTSEIPDEASINQTLIERGHKEKLFIVARKENQPILLFGPVKQAIRSGHKIYIIKKEIVRSPAATLDLVAFTTQKHEIVIRQEALENIFWRKWIQDINLAAKPYANQTLQAYGVTKQSQLVTVKKLFLQEMLETTVIHELCHITISENYHNKDLLILAKLLSAMITDCPLSAYDEALAEWLPEDCGSIGVIPYLAKMAQTDYHKAKRMFYRYLADSYFGNPEQKDLLATGQLLLRTLTPYIDSNEEINFEAIRNNNGQIYDYLLGQFNLYLNKIMSLIKNATFSYNGLSVDFATLALAQEKNYPQQNKHFFWANMIKYLKNCSPETYQKIVNLRVFRDDPKLAKNK